MNLQEYIKSKTLNNINKKTLLDTIAEKYQVTDYTSNKCTVISDDFNKIINDLYSFLIHTDTWMVPPESYNHNHYIDYLLQRMNSIPEEAIPFITQTLQSAEYIFLQEDHSSIENITEQYQVYSALRIIFTNAINIFYNHYTKVDITFTGSLLSSILTSTKYENMSFSPIFELLMHRSNITIHPSFHYLFARLLTLTELLTQVIQHNTTPPKSIPVLLTTLNLLVSPTEEHLALPTNVLIIQLLQRLLLLSLTIQQATSYLHVQFSSYHRETQTGGYYLSSTERNFGTFAIFQRAARSLVSNPFAVTNATSSPIKEFYGEAYLTSSILLDFNFSRVFYPPTANQLRRTILNDGIQFCTMLYDSLYSEFYLQRKSPPHTITTQYHHFTSSYPANSYNSPYCFIAAMFRAFIINKKYIDLKNTRPTLQITDKAESKLLKSARETTLINFNEKNVKALLFSTRNATSSFTPTNVRINEITNTDELLSTYQTVDNAGPFTPSTLLTLQTTNKPNQYRIPLWLGFKDTKLGLITPLNKDVINHILKTYNIPRNNHKQAFTPLAEYLSVPNKTVYSFIFADTALLVWSDTSTSFSLFFANPTDIEEIDLRYFFNQENLINTNITKQDMGLFIPFNTIKISRIPVADITYFIFATIYCGNEERERLYGALNSLVFDYPKQLIKLFNNITFQEKYAV